MRVIFSAVVAGLMLCESSFAQNTNAQNTNSSPASGAAQPSEAAQQGTAPAQASSTSGPVAANPRIAPGSVIPVQLTKSIDAKKVKTGDPVEAKVTEDVKTNSGEIIVPKDTKLVGHLTEAQARNKEQKESQVTIAFDHALTRTGSDMTLPMSIQAVISPSYLAPSNNAGGEEGPGQPASSPSAGMSPGNNPGRSSGMGEAQAQPQASASPSAGEMPGAPQNTVKRQPITGNIQGVLGFENLKLSTGDVKQGSVLTSEKNNVKLESGTLMLLRVNP
jgi:hypothetical protein